MPLCWGWERGWIRMGLLLLLALGHTKKPEISWASLPTGQLSWSGMLETPQDWQCLELNPIVSPVNSWLGQERPWEGLDPQRLPGTSHPSSGAAACVGVCRKSKQQLSQCWDCKPAHPCPGIQSQGPLGDSSYGIAGSGGSQVPLLCRKVEKTNGSVRFVSRFPASNLQGGAEGRSGASWARSHGMPSALGWESPRISCMCLDFLSSFLLPLVFCPPT